MAIPLQRAIRFSAVRSPRRMCRAWPRTVATFVTGSRTDPSNHRNTLATADNEEMRGDTFALLVVPLYRAVQILENAGEERYSSKNAFAI